MILSLITSRLAGPIASGVAVILAVALGWQTVALIGARSKATKAEATAQRALSDFTTCKANHASLEAAQKAQDAAVAALKADSARMVAQSAKEARAAKSVAESYRRQAAEVMASRPASDDLCKEAELMLRGRI